LVWPNDHAWFLATDTDLDFTSVGGSQSLMADLAAEERLSAEVLDADARLVPEAE
jgi:hypothetical protein